jgi:hypothetical protein
MDEREILVSRLLPRRKTGSYRATGFGRASGVGGMFVDIAEAADVPCLD